MSPHDAPNARVHTRCPCCGRLALLPPGSVLPPAFRLDHAIDGMTQVSVGGGRGGGAGFEWTPRELDQAELTELEQVVSAVGGRLRQQIGGELAAEVREAELRAEIAALRKKNKILVKTLKLAQIELRKPK